VGLYSAHHRMPAMRQLCGDCAATFEEEKYHSPLTHCKPDRRLSLGYFLGGEALREVQLCRRWLQQHNVAVSIVGLRKAPRKDLTSKIRFCVERDEHEQAPAKRHHFVLAI
jgi:hypothetical protein